MKLHLVCGLALSLASASSISGCAGGETEDLDEEIVGTSEEALTVFQWSAPVEISGPRTDDAVALGAYRGSAHMVYTKQGGADLYHTVYDGASWSAAVQIPNQRSKNRPALAAMGSKANSVLHMVHQGETSDALWWSVYNGSSWTANSAIGMSSTQAPIMATYGVGLHLFGTNAHTTCSFGTSCSTNELLWESTFDGLTWSPPQEIVTTANHAIDGVGGAAVAVYNGTPVLVVRRASNDLWMYTYQNGAWSGGTKVPGQKSKSAPTLASFGGYLHMSHLGDSSSSVWWSYWDGVSWAVNNTIPNATSDWATAMAPAGSKLVQAFRQYCGNSVCWGGVQFQTFQ